MRELPEVSEPPFEDEAQGEGYDGGGAHGDEERF